MPPDTPASIYQLKITLKRSKPPIWRRVLVSSSITLERLHRIIQSVMEWDGSHSHGFSDPKPSPAREFDFSLSIEEMLLARFQEMENDPLRNEELTLINQFLIAVKDRLLYEYDFGDSWEHVIELEKILPPNPELRVPVCIAGKLAAPVDDVGGTWGYYHYLEMRSAPKAVRDKDEHYSSIKDFFPKGFDPNVFDLEAVNERLAWFQPGLNGGNHYRIIRRLGILRFSPPSSPAIRH